MLAFMKSLIIYDYHLIFQPTLAGQCYLDLRKNWTTNEFLTASDFGVMENVRVFHGGYNVEVSHYTRGELVCIQETKSCLR